MPDAAALLSALGAAPGVFLALAAAPLLRSPVAVVLITVDLALVMEIEAVLVDPGYAYGSELLARLLASAVHVALAGAALHAWRRLRRPAAAAVGRP